MGIPKMVSNVFQQPPSAPDGANLSTLTGLPLDMSHANMQPMFGKTIRQPGHENENSQVLLERFTGVPSSENQGTYSKRREVENPPPKPDVLQISAFQNTNIYNLKDIYSRTQIKDSHDYVSPTNGGFRDYPSRHETVTATVLPPNIDATRSILRKQKTNTVAVIPGQKGSSRSVIPNIKRLADKIESKLALPTKTQGISASGSGNKQLKRNGPLIRK
ncbi:UNVERIFIED_CONTAM: hypothetical protein HDU68_000090, partial [Siphonaria sp. JEL0065]